MVFAIACMALNILVGHTGLVSFGHGAWFGLAAYAAALIQRNWMPSSFFGPTMLARCRRGHHRGRLRLPDPAPARRVFLAADAGAGGDAVRGRRSAGPTSPAARTASAASPGRHCFGFNLDPRRNLLLVRGAIAFLVLVLLWRFHNSTVGTRAGGDPRERTARALPRLSDQSLQARRLRAVGGDHRARRHSAAVPRTA